MDKTTYDLSGSEGAWKQPPAGGAGTFAQPIPTERGEQPYRLAKWRGEPGTYDRQNGMPWDEIFVVYKGRGRVRMHGSVSEIGPGSVIELRKGVPYILEIDETLEKMAVINE